MQALLLHKSQSMNNGQELTNIIGTFHRPKMENPGTCSQVNSLIFHGSWVATACSIHSPRVCPYLWRQGQNCVVAV